MGSGPADDTDGRQGLPIFLRCVGRTVSHVRDTPFYSLLLDIYLLQDYARSSIYSMNPLALEVRLMGVSTS
jgi:hypothetical protein